ncbi:ABC-2 transporter permease [Paenibacillus sp. y28]|uniref:ABC-2 transporter permease n=1 Tax=Paenibacillus sp. y28 TaxID=3129110 RepID=UPI0030184745
MRRMWAICSKELQLYFYSPVVYVAFAFYFLISGYMFSLDFLTYQVVDIRPLFSNLLVVFLFVIPLLTMRLVADELRQGTDELLLTSPAKITEIIAGKYAAAVIVMLALIAGTLVYPWIMSAYGDLDQPVLWLSYLGMALLGAAMMAVGLFASTLSSHQMVSGIAGFAMLLLLWMIEWLGQSMYGKLKDYLGQFSIIGRMQNFNKGLLDLSDVLFYVLFILVFLVLSIQVLERKRWR